MYLYVTIGINLKNITLNAKNFIRIHSTRPTYVDVKTYQWLIVTHDPVYPSSNKKNSPSSKIWQSIWVCGHVARYFLASLKAGYSQEPNSAQCDVSRNMCATSLLHP